MLLLFMTCAFLLNLTALLLSALVHVQPEIGFALISLLFFMILLALIVTTLLYPHEHENVENVGLENRIIVSQERNLHDITAIMKFQKSHEMRRCGLLSLNDYTNYRYRVFNGNGISYIASISDDKTNDKNEKKEIRSNLQLVDIIGHFDDADYDMVDKDILKVDIDADGYDADNADDDSSAFSKDAEAVLIVTGNTAILDSVDYDDVYNSGHRDDDLLQSDVNIQLLVNKVSSHANSHTVQLTSSNSYRDNNNSTSNTAKIYIDGIMRDAIQKIGLSSESAITSDLRSDGKATDIKILMDRLMVHANNNVNQSTDNDDQVGVQPIAIKSIDKAANLDEVDDDDCEAPSPAIILHEVKSSMFKLLNGNQPFKRKDTIKLKPLMQLQLEPIIAPRRGINRKGKSRRMLSSRDTEFPEIKPNILLSKHTIKNKNSTNSHYKYSGRYRSRILRMNNSKNPIVVFPSIDENVNEKNNISKSLPQEMDIYHKQLGPGSSLVKDSNGITIGIPEGDGVSELNTSWFLLTPNRLNHTNTTMPFSRALIPLSSSSSPFKSNSIDLSTVSDSQNNSNRLSNRSPFDNSKINPLSILRKSILQQSFVKNDLRMISNSNSFEETNYSMKDSSRNSNINNFVMDHIYKEKINLPQYLLEVKQYEKIPSLDILSLPEHIVMSSELSTNEILARNVLEHVNALYDDHDNGDDNSNIDNGFDDTDEVEFGDEVKIALSRHILDINNDNDIIKFVNN